MSFFVYFTSRDVGNPAMAAKSGGWEVPVEFGRTQGVASLIGQARSMGLASMVSPINTIYMSGLQRCRHVLQYMSYGKEDCGFIVLF